MKKFFTTSASIILFALAFLSFLTFPTQSKAANGWTEQRGSGTYNWVSIAPSSDGSHLVALSYKGYIYTSSDYGVTWTQRTNDTGRVWFSVTSSDSGQYLAAIVYGGNVWTSSDYGVTWTAVANSANSIGRSWYAIDSSADGQYLVAIVRSGNIWTSADYGATWSNINNAGARLWRAVTSSADGKYLAATVRNGNVWTSSNYGANWTERVIDGSAATYFFTITSSALGDKLVMADTTPGGYIYNSTDYGATWTPRFNIPTAKPDDQWNTVSYSSDGTKLVVSMYGQYLYQSLDDGVTWTVITGAGKNNWQPAVYSPDGSKIIAGTDGAYIYTYGAITSSPIITSTSAVAGSSTITLNGNASTQSTARNFDYGLTASYGNTLSSSQTGVLNLETFSTSIPSILTDTVYHYRVGATNDFGSNSSADASFNILPFNQKASDTIHDWKSIAVSSDGKYMAAVVSGGYIYTSNDYGNTWLQKTSDTARAWSGITSSASGQYLAAVVSGDYVYTSSDYGNTWSQKTSDLARNWKSIASSASGQYLAAVVNGGYIYTSSDYGNTWTVRKNDTTRNWQSVSVSSLGDKMIAIKASTNYVYVSSDYGVTWSEIVGNGLNSGLTADVITISGDGTKAVVGDDSGSLYTSSDNGATWTPQVSAGVRIWQSIVTSADGSKIMAVDNGGYIYNSLDGGISWVEQSSAGTGAWQSIAASADGSVIAAVANSGYIYTYKPSASTLSTGTASNIAAQSVTLNGNILNNGGVSDTTRGFEYGLDTSYGSTTSETGSFNISSYGLDIDSLTCGTTYHYRAYATNITGTSYGNDVSFATLNCPGLTTGSASSITLSSASLQANISETGGVNFTTRGFEYGLDNSYGTTINETGSYGLGSYNLSASALRCGTTYHYRAYAINTLGTIHSSDASFVTINCPSSNPFVLPASVGTGKSEATIPMNTTSSIGNINSDGVNILTYLGAQANFKAPKSSLNWQLGDYSLKVADLNLATNVITLNLDSKIITLQKGESKNVDLDGDKINDLKLTFTNIYVNRAELTVASLKNNTVTAPVVIKTQPVVTPVTTPTTTIKKSFVFNKDLKLNQITNDVKELQKFLNNHGYVVATSGAGSKGKETTKFGPATKTALIKFQKANKITPASGLFGPLTRKTINNAK